MKIKDHLYFAPGVSFHGLNVYAPDILGKFRRRIEGYYLEPARLLTKEEHAFAATVLLVSCLDALARYDSINPKNSGGNRKRYIDWLNANMPKVFSENFATIFYDDIRCGAVHEARIKNGCVFTFYTGSAIFCENNIMAVNPERLADHVTDALNQFCEARTADPSKLKKFQDDLKDDFNIELKTSNI